MTRPALAALILAGLSLPALAQTGTQRAPTTPGAPPAASAPPAAAAPPAVATPPAAATPPPAATRTPTPAQAAQQQRMRDCNAQAATRSLSGPPRQEFMRGCLSSGPAAPAAGTPPAVAATTPPPVSGAAGRAPAAPATTPSRTP